MYVQRERERELLGGVSGPREPPQKMKPQALPTPGRPCLLDDPVSCFIVVATTTTTTIKQCIYIYIYICIYICIYI